jgi:hypothetical protein
VVVVAAIGACLILIAGCGGGGDDNSTTSASTGTPQITTPGTFNPGTRSTPNGPQAQRTTSTPAAPGNHPPGAQPVGQALVPFRDCLGRHGVDPTQFRLGFQGQGQQQRDPAQVQKQIQAGIACIPELPPRLRKSAERLKRRYEQRNG